MQLRSFGHSGIQVSAIGFGAGHIGGSEINEAQVAYLLDQALELGINLIDTARGYGESEARIGKWLQTHRREEIVLSTKIGYGMAGIPDWTADCIVAGVDFALNLMRCDYLDIVHLHSCSLETLQQSDVIPALQALVKAGKVRVMAYSGENQALEWSIDSAYFGSVQCSVNLCDRYSLNHVLPRAAQHGLGVIAKRPLANAFWRFEQAPIGDYSYDYWQRWQQMQIDLDMPMPELAARFTAFAPTVSTAIIGTRRLENLQSLVQAVSKGPLPDDISELLHQAYAPFDSQWPGLI